MSRSGGGAGRALERLLRDGVVPPGGDARLLQRFLADRDPSAFEAIVDRHGPPVLAVCRRYLRDPADVEDAFQATFLVLVRKASGIRDGDALSSWLYGVAYRVALRARSDALKRHAREGTREGLEDASAAPSRPMDDALEILDAEMTRLPEKYRAPLALCHLRGRTHDQAAAELGWPVGTVRSRMARGRALLRDRLSRRGVDAPLCLAAARAEVAAIPIVPSSLVAATASAAVRFAGVSAGLIWLGASPSSSVSPAVRLALGVLATMSTTPWKVLGVALACAGLTVGALAAGSVAAPGDPQDPPNPEPPPAVANDAPGDVESRLSEVERKLDRMMGMLESLTAGPMPSASPPVAARANVFGSTASAPPIVEARTLREIEAQLVNLERKYRIVDALVRNARAPALDREDVLAPARVLVARLREMEDQEQAKLTEAETRHGLPPGTLDDPERAATLVADLFKLAEEPMKRAEEALKTTKIEPGNVIRVPGGIKFGDTVDARTREIVKEHWESFQRLQSLGAVFGRRIDDWSWSPWLPGSSPLREPIQTIPSVLDQLRSTYARLAEIRRPIAWAKARFPDVELTIDDEPADADAAKKGTVESPSR